MKKPVLLGFVGVFTAAAAAQTHVVKKPEAVVRAIAVYEWTGEEGKATASRVVPVSLFINRQLQDAGVYLARPVPFALDTGTVYETQKAGVPEGTLELAYERHLTPSDTAQVDDGWLAYGAFKPKPKETLVAKKQSGPLPKLEVSGGSKPHFSTKPLPAGDPSTDTSAKTDDAEAGRKDPDRPTFHKRPGDNSAETSKPAESSPAKTGDASDPEDPVERPTLKRRSPAEIKADQKKKETAKVVAGSDLNEDPDRPNLHRGKPVSRMEEDDLPPLRGLPAGMHQMVAVSDAHESAEHDFSRPWQSDAERADILSKMQTFARAQLAAYKGVPPLSAPLSDVASTSAHGTATSKARRRISTPPAAAALSLTDERLEGYELSYGGAPTYFYMATSAGAGAVARYVSVVAQEEPIAGLKVAIANVTDAAHLDRTPWMRLVDVVDADASNRASLLMELRAQHTRQFALYRVIGAHADQIFATGSIE